MRRPQPTYCRGQAKLYYTALGERCQEKRFDFRTHSSYTNFKLSVSLAIVEE
jgi:hypothetical protein